MLINQSIGCCWNQEDQLSGSLFEADDDNSDSDLDMDIDQFDTKPEVGWTFLQGFILYIMQNIMVLGEVGGRGMLNGRCGNIM